MILDTELEKGLDLVKKMKASEGQTLEEEITMKVHHLDTQVPDTTEVPIEVKREKIGEIIKDNLLIETILTDTTKVAGEIGAKKRQVIYRLRLLWFSLLVTLN